MLSLTPDAVDAVRTVMALEDRALRFSAGPPSQNGSGPAVRVDAVRAPDIGDTVLEADGAQIYLEPAAAVALEDKILHAEHKGETVHFEVYDRDE